MIRLYYSNYLEELVGELVKTSTQSSSEIWDSATHVVVPNKNISTYLKLQIARRRGVAADIQTTYLRPFLRGCLAQDVNAFEKPFLQSFIFSILSDSDFLQQDATEGVRRYLAGPDHRDGDANPTSNRGERELRIFQLSIRLATLFEEYALNRRELVAHWEKNTILEDKILGENEVWQRAIWNEIFKKGGRLEQYEEQTQTRWVSSADVFSSTDFFSKGKLPDEIHFFAFSYVALAYYKMLSDLGQYTNVHIYALNPCMEYWEDLSGFSAKTILPSPRFDKRKNENQLLLFGDQFEEENRDPKALKAWGRPGRDHIHLLNMLTDSDFDSAFIDPSAHNPGLLQIFQKDILMRQELAPRASEKSLNLVTDDTLSIVASPSIQREVEHVANEIWATIAAYHARGEKLNFNDILVVVNQDEKEIYQSRITSIFKGTHAIPHNLADLDAKRHRRFLEGVDLLFVLPTTGFERRAMLSLLTHPNAMAKTPKIDRELWISWCDSLSVFHGGDASDHANTYIDKHLYHWQQALNRLVLGCFMSAQAPAGQEKDIAYQGEEGPFLPIEIKGSEVYDAAELVHAVGALIDHSRELARKEQSLAEWAVSLRLFIESFLKAESDEDQYSMTLCWQSLQKMEDSDLCGTPVSYEVALTYFQRDLDLMTVSKGYYLTDGVVISSFLPMRPIPFKVVFLTGMGDHQFPHRDPKNAIDLRWARAFRPVRGDTVSPRARDEYMFLETLICAREKIVLSYVCQHQSTGEEQQPAAPLRQLQFILENDYLAKGESILTTLNKIRHEENSKTSYIPEIPQEAHARALRLCLENEKSPELESPNSADLLTYRFEPEVLHKKLKDFLKLPRFGGRRANAVAKISLPLSMLKRFLETPLQASAEYHLGLWNEQLHDRFDVEDEQFELSRAERRSLLKRILQACKERPDSKLEEVIFDICQLDSLRGRFPSGPFFKGEIRRIRSVVHQWMDHLETLDTSMGQLEKLHFGGQSLDPIDLGTLDIDGEDIHVEIVGESDWLDLENMKTISFRAMNYRPRRTDNWVLNGFIDLVALSAAGLVKPREESDHWQVVINITKDANPWSQVERIIPIEKEKARAYLRTLSQELLLSKSPYLLPSEAVFENIRQGIALSEAIENIVSTPYSACHFGPVKEIEKFSTPPHRKEICRTRFGLFFDNEFREVDK